MSLISFTISNNYLDFGYKLNRILFSHLPKTKKMTTERVQALACIGNLKELPEKFIRPADERPENTKPLEGVTVPIISLMESDGDLLVKEIHKACSEWGFFLLKDHGISFGLIEKLQEVGMEFFKQPQEEKEKYANDPSIGKFEGYGTKMTKNLDEKVEWVDYFFHIMSPPSQVDYQIWPQIPSSYRYVNQSIP